MSAHYLCRGGFRRRQLPPSPQLQVALALALLCRLLAVVNYKVPVCETREDVMENCK